MDILTDVITFNLSEDEKDLEAEIYISWERIDDNAKIYSQKINSEVKRVIIHGCLHLVGYDDSTEKEKKYQISMLAQLHKGNKDKSAELLNKLQNAAIQNQNIFELLIEAAKVCSLGEITNALFEVGGQYRRNM